MRVAELVKLHFQRFFSSFVFGAWNRLVGEALRGVIRSPRSATILKPEQVQEWALVECGMQIISPVLILENTGRRSQARSAPKPT
jgi:hypothetical protein